VKLGRLLLLPAFFFVVSVAMADPATAAGECNCGAIRFEIDVPLRDVYVCHCSICRRSTGSSDIAVVLVPKERFRWVRGEDHVATWHKPGADWATSFCRTCGSRVPGENDDTRVFAPAGCITEGGESLRVAHHIFVASKAAWDEIGDAGRQHDTRVT
jgi:hypothetical protein